VTVDRIPELIRALLDFARVRLAGKEPVWPALMDLADIAYGVVDELRLAWPHHNIHVETHGDTRGQWDPAPMAQVISNLVGNAITHAEAGTPVRVSVAGNGDQVALRVTNHGAPIPLSLMPILFEPFHRGRPDGRARRGLGLELYGVQQIVLAHNGTIDVDSTAQAGTTFAVRLPRVPAHWSVHKT
jgi:signal transduction histidine kinase